MICAAFTLVAFINIFIISCKAKCMGKAGTIIWSEQASPDNLRPLPWGLIQGDGYRPPIISSSFIFRFSRFSFQFKNHIIIENVKVLDFVRFAPRMRDVWHR